ncbi:MAG: hypothetical protein AAGG51_02280 [Cyanobacteria bacterium P01_G01_bin.54]
MVQYEIIGASRTSMLFGLAIFSTILSSSLTRLFTSFNLTVVAPSGLMIFGILFFLFDRFLWKFPGINYLTGVPNISGIWEGSGHIEYFAGVDERADAGEVKSIVIVTQSWTRIDLVLMSPSTRSRLKVASLDCSNSLFPSLTYIYEVKPTKTGGFLQSPAEGACETTIHRNENSRMVGTWYSGEDKTGLFSLKKVYKPEEVTKSDVSEIH